MFEETLHFYRDILLLDSEEIFSNQLNCFRLAKIIFGSINLWLIEIPDNDKPEIFLELNTNQINAALDFLNVNHISIQMIETEKSNKITTIKDPAGNVLTLKGLEMKAKK
ncbi:hypothetical protein [Sphingobacterium endophyticum]|uniref:hypothetical protein n=1 Tax=Sphingobacterium endophyticum TaxID=2546448 RepID=UPI0012E1CC25|nr:hypothetical protein [Sphingobacterium endophyticum]